MTVHANRQASASEEHANNSSRDTARLLRPVAKCHRGAWGNSYLAAGPAAMTHPDSPGHTVGIECKWERADAATAHRGDSLSISLIQKTLKCHNESRRNLP